MLITGPCIEAVRSLFDGSFNSTVTSLSHAELAIDWTPATSLQFFEFNATPDDLERSDVFRYPCCFLHGIRSTNLHEQYGTDFSGRVELSLRFYVTSKSAKVAPAGRYLEAAGNAIESAVNALLADNQWPQLFGVPSAVCGAWPMARQQMTPAGEGWRQGFVFQLSIELTTS